jgi:hypothetical protein
MASAGATVTERLDRELLSGALVRGSARFGSAHLIYCIVGDPDRAMPHEELQRSAWLVRTDGSGTCYVGAVSFGSDGAVSIWRP